MQRNSPLIDTHTHIVSDQTHRFPQRDMALANGAWWQEADCSFGQLAGHASRSAVDRVVMVQAAGPYGDDNSYLAEALAIANIVESGSPFSGVCIVDPTSDSGPPATERLRSLATQHFAGLRLFHIPQPEVSWLAGQTASELIDTCAELGLVVTVCCLPAAFDDVATQLVRRPDVPVVLDHCGFADFTGGPPFAGADPLWRLAEFPNLMIKFTPTLVRQNDTPEQEADPSQLLSALVDHFGAERIMWGSDWPQHREVGEGGRRLTYAKQVERIQSWMGHLSPTQQQLIAGGNAARIWSFHGRQGHEMNEDE